MEVACREDRAEVAVELVMEHRIVCREIRPHCGGPIGVVEPIGQCLPLGGVLDAQGQPLLVTGAGVHPLQMSEQAAVPVAAQLGAVGRELDHLFGRHVRARH